MNDLDDTTPHNSVELEKLLRDFADSYDTRITMEIDLKSPNILPALNTINAVMNYRYSREDDVENRISNLLTATSALQKLLTPFEYRTFHHYLQFANEVFIHDFADITRDEHRKENKCVYVFGTNNDTVKIGVAVDVEKRISAIEHASGAEVLKYCATALMNAKKAFEIESACHKHFKDKRLKGEFFKITFDEACAELQKHAEIVERYE